MKKTLLLITALIFAAVSVFAQDPEDSREVQDVRETRNVQELHDASGTQTSQGVLYVQPEVDYESGIITGQVVSRSSRQPIDGVVVTITTNPEVTVKSDRNGKFTFKDIPYGRYSIILDAPEYAYTRVNVIVNAVERDINMVMMSPDIALADLDDGSFAEYDFEGGDYQPMPVTLSASRDVFDNISGYKFSPLRFRSRGYDSSLQNVYMNGIMLNDAMNGYSPWSLWSGLNEVTRNQESASGLATFDFGIGGVNGLTNIDTRASALRHGFRASMVHADAQYLTRFMATYASGMQDNGWAFAASVSLRYGPNLWVDGVYYNAWGYYFGVEKQINPLHRLSFSFLGVPTKRGAQMGATDEAYSYAGRYYNPNWGYQGGEMRNARVRDYHEPLSILNYEFKISDNTIFNVAASFRFGKNGYSALDWYKGRDPKPDYYRNFPSYWEIRGEEDKNIDAHQNWLHNTDNTWHVNWDWMHDVNRNNEQIDYDQNGNQLPVGRSRYIVSDRRTDQRDFNINAHISHRFDKYSLLNAGISARINRTEYFQTVKDLLGGKYWVNVDNFAARDESSGATDAGNAISENIMNDISGNSDLVVYEGDKYGYDYYGNLRNSKLWASYTITKGRFEGFAAAEVGLSNVWRKGLYQKGLFPDSSLGDSEKLSFLSHTEKLGARYRISGQSNIAITGIAMEKAPNFYDAFVSPRTRNTVAPDLTTEKYYGGDITYSLRTPWLTMRLSGYYTLIKDKSKLISYYDDTQRSFGNFAMRGIDQQHMGIELGFRVPVYAGLSVTGAASLGNYTYVSNPSFIQTIDNSAQVILEDIIEYNGLYVENTPQTAINIGLNYRSESYWFIGLDLCYYDNYYLSMNPQRRAQSFLDHTASAAELGGKDGDLARFNMWSQERFDPAITLGANIGKSWYIQRKYNIGFSFEVKNILNNQSIRTGGYEQMRYYAKEVVEDSGVYEYTPFDTRYFYLYGFNYYLNVYFRF